MKLLTQTGSVP